MTIKGWQRAVIIVGAGAVSFSPAVAAVADETPTVPNAAVSEAAPAQGGVQKLPPGYHIQGSTLYNGKNEAVELPTGWTVNGGVIYDAHSRVAPIAYRPEPAAPLTDTAPQGGATALTDTIPLTDAAPGGEAAANGCGPEKEEAGSGLLGGLFGEFFCLVGGVTRAVFGPDGLLELEPAESGTGLEDYPANSEGGLQVDSAQPDAGLQADPGQPDADAPAKPDSGSQPVPAKPDSGSQAAPADSGAEQD
ncbi:hypothetical protein SMC26_02085 [Actinomadura fulvescens]|uniref:Secreted protein n=1 Tax=Actinomadura fulvescens TaxID=46160 RepID=A0ABP6BT73_9ACTN